MAIATFALSVLSSVAASAQTPYDEMARDRAEADLRRYHALLSAYAAGDEAESVEAVLLWDKRAFSRALALADGPFDPLAPWDPRRYGLAVLLHSDASLQLYERSLPAAAFAHFEIASNLLRMGLQRDSDRLRPLARRWYVTISRVLRNRDAPFDAERLLALARERLPEDPVVLYESGTLAEALATDYALSGAAFFRATRAQLDINVDDVLNRRARRLADAADWLGRASAQDAGNQLIRLHLGRVQALRRNARAALEELTEVLSGTSEDEMAYLAALFTAGVYEAQLRFEEAAAAYRRAIGRLSNGQAAYIGLSEVLRRLGKGDESRTVLLELLAESHGPTREPLWWYQFEPPGVAEERLAALRREMRR